MPICSIIIPHLNQSCHLERCLAALNEQSYRDKDFEVIVIDNGSEEDVSDLVKGYGYHYYQYTQDYNPYSCRNLGILKAKGSVLAFLDAKCIPDRTWLEEGLEGISKADLVGGHYDICTNDHTLSHKIFPLMYLNNQKNVEKGNGVSAGNLFMKKKVVDTIGFFETDHVSGNDILFTEKAMNRGYVLAYAHSCTVSYPAKSFKELKSDVYKYGIGAFATRQKSLWDSMTFYLPMRIHNFKKALEFRNFDLSTSEAIRAWVLIWRVKIQFALGILYSAFTKSHTT